MPRQPQIPFDQSVYRPTFHPIPTRGVAPDLPQEQIGDTYLASALNFLVRDGRVQKREGIASRWPADTPFSTSLGNLRSLFEFTSTRAPASSMILAQFGTSMYYAAATSTAWTNISPPEALTPGLYHWTTFISASNGQEVYATYPGARYETIRWNGSTATSFTALSSAVVGTSNISWRNHLLLGDTEDTADGAVVTRVHWSRLGDGATWAGTASAGSIDLNDANASRILTFRALRSTLIAYKEEAAHALIYKTAPFYFTQQLLHPTLSLVAPHAICDTQNGQWHFLLTKEGAVLWDGQTVRPIGRDRVDRTILNSITWSARNNIFAVWWELTQEVLLSIPTGGTVNPTRLWIYNTIYDAWWETDMRAFCARASTYTASTPSLLGSRIGGTDDVQNMWRLFTGTEDGSTGAAISASLQTGLYDYGSLAHKRSLQLAALFGPGTGTQATIAVTKAGQENPVVAPSFDSAQSLTSTGGADLPRIDYGRTDRWMAYRVTHTSTGETVEVAGLAPYTNERTDSQKRRS